MDSKLLYPYKLELYFTKLILRAMMMLNKKVPENSGTQRKLLDKKIISFLVIDLKSFAINRFEGLTLLGVVCL